MSEVEAQLDSPEESIPRSIVPWPRDDDKSRYLGLCASGFHIREALGLIGKAKSTLSKWRHDPVFVDLENRLPELRKTLALEYAALEFLRNYRLVLEKDFRIIKSSLAKKTVIQVGDNKVTVPMDAQDFKYLLQLRSHYTPQQLQAIEQLFGRGDASSKEVNWTDFFIEMSRTTDTMKIGTRKRQEPQLGLIVEGEVTEVKPDVQ